MVQNSFPTKYKYTKDHEWVEVGSRRCKVGVTAFAVEQLGDIVHLELPQMGSTYKSGDSFGTIESTKTVSDLYMPVAGKVVARNDKALQNPEKLQEDPYLEGWLVEVEIDQENELIKLMNAADYEKYLKETGE